MCLVLRVAWRFGPMVSKAGKSLPKHGLNAPMFGR